MINYSTFLKATILAFTLSITLTSLGQTHQNALDMNGYYQGSSYTSVIDDNKNIYLGGSYTDSIVFGTTVHQTTFAPNGFIVKLNQQGNYQWSNSIEGNDLINLRDIELSNSGELYVIGDFMGTASFSATTTLTSNGVFDVFLAKYDTTGNFIWAISFGGPAPDWGYGLTIDQTDNIIVTGSFLVFTDFDPSAGNATINSFGSSPDIFLAKYDSSGNYLWAKNAGSTAMDQGNDVEVDAFGNIYLTGFIGGVSTFDTTNVGNIGSNDVFLAKYDSLGNNLWAYGFGGTSADEGTDLKIGQDQIFLTGTFEGSANMEPQQTSPDLFSVGDKDIFIASYDTSGNHQWSLSFGGVSEDVSRSINTDTANNIFLSGFFNDTVDFAHGEGSVRVGSQGGKDIFMTKYNDQGQYIWAHGFGNSGDDEAYHIATHQDEFYLSGGFNNTIDFDPASASNNNLTATQSGSIFLAKYGICYNNHQFDSTTFCKGGNFQIGSQYTFDEKGTYHLRLENTNVCDTLITLNLEIDSVNVSLIQNSDTLSAEDTSSVYSWLDCTADTLITGETASTYIATISGDYACIITDTVLGCTDTSACTSVMVVGINEFQNKRIQQVELYPNPTTDLLYIETNKVAAYKIYNTMGKTVLQGVLNKGKNQLQASQLDEGIYFLRTLDGKTISKFIVME